MPDDSKFVSLFKKKNKKKTCLPHKNFKLLAQETND